jgi:hypothetical protein
MLLKNNNAIIYGAGDVYCWAHLPQQIQDIDENFCDAIAQFKD